LSLVIRAPAGVMTS